MSPTREWENLRKKVNTSETLSCKPLDNMHDIQYFLDNPPSWRTLCEELTPHSKYVIRNMENDSLGDPEQDPNAFLVENTPLRKNYCHYVHGSSEPKRYDMTEDRIPKTLVCHDMANGYHDDSVMGGTTNYSSYTFYNWAGIDIFCYFSHHLITIPPLAWINVGHAHGVKVIGTIITEWAEGALFWEQVLSSEVEYSNFASAVVAIAKTLKFDGYLLNIENKISKPDVLLEFVKHLRETLHRELDDPVLIWYDSVTIKGNLSWQNKLNGKNIDFFNACDGFFTNYSWSVEDVKSSAELAGNRITDLYIGIDVWGRNFYGGGQYNTQEAVKLVHHEGCSLAIFAPAWTHESMNDDPEDPNFIKNAHGLNKLQRFILRDRALWGTLWPYLHTRLPSHLPFQTSFCRGQGLKRWLYGEVISPGPWYNLRHQQYQPNAAHGQHAYVLSPAKIAAKQVKAGSYTSIHSGKKGIIKTHDSYREPEEEIVERHVKSVVAKDTPLPSKVPSAVTPSTTKAPSRDASTSPIFKVQPVRPPKKNISWRIKRLVEIISLNKIKLLPKTEDKSSSRRESKSDSIHDQGQTSKSLAAATPAAAPTDKALIHASFNPAADSASPEDADADEEEGLLKLPPGMITPPKRLPKTTPKADDQTHDESLATMSVNLNLFSIEGKLRWTLSFKHEERECLQLYFKDAFLGGSCLRINPSDRVTHEHRMIRLFHCDFECENTLIFCVVTKQLVQYPDQSLNLILSMLNTDNKELEVVMLGRDLGLHSHLDEHSAGINCVYPLHKSDDPEFQDLRKYLLINEPAFYVPVVNHYGWNVRYYLLPVPGGKLLSINCRTVLEYGGILLGYLAICNKGGCAAQCTT